MELIVISSAGALALVATQLLSYAWLSAPARREVPPDVGDCDCTADAT